MQGPAWINLLSRVPPDQHDCLTLVTTTNAEIVLQRLVHLDNDFLVAVGRLGGSTDQGKLMVIPYDQLTYLAFNKKLSDAEIGAVLNPSGIAHTGALFESRTSTLPSNGTSPPADANQLSPAASSLSQPDSNTNSSADTPPLGKVAAQDDASRRNTKAPMPSKSVLLARLRQRLADDASKQLKP
jgi:hypothetical protein